MLSKWNDADARKAIDSYGAKGVGEDLALRVYTTRLLGQDPKLVLHGGGNTSVKTRLRDPLGDEIDVLCVKGSGWDMGRIEPAGLPAVRLDPLRRIEARDALSDEDMVNFQRINLLDAGAPNPSVETLLHAFLPAKFIDHTHANAILALTDQPNGEDLAREIYGERMAIVPYVMPGFELAKEAGRAHRREPDAKGLVLLKHGIFTYGADARTAYELMIEMVSLAEARLARGRRNVFASAALPEFVAPLQEVAPILRGIVSREIDRNEGAYARQILEFRTGPEILNYVNGAELERYARQGVITPDHNLRTKNWPLIVPAPEAGRLDEFRKGAAERMAEFATGYDAYFARNNPKFGGNRKKLDPMPRVILVPGLGLFGLGKSAKDAAIAADIATETIATVTDAEAIGRYEPITEEEMFEVEYWSLEQAKLGKEAEKPLARQVALVTGAGGGIGAATAKALARAGAEVALLDLDGAAAEATAKAIGGAAYALACDVTDARAVDAAFDFVCRRFGGVDIVVSNAGAAWQGRMAEVDDQALRKSFELNFFAHQNVARSAVRVMKAQGTGGALLFNVSKQAVNPGPDFGPYGLPKATTLFLSRQYALEHGGDGIRVNAVNADRIATGIFKDGLLEQRAKARGVTVQQYLSDGNLLKREVKADDVAEAFLYLAQARKTTGCVLTVDGGNIAAALR
jgi:rhamnulose-1-phosphate aldolase/alcohol dehydrogenase